MSAQRPRSPSTLVVGLGLTGEAVALRRLADGPVVVVEDHPGPGSAHRAARLGIARVIPRTRYSPDRLAQGLAAILGEDGYRAAAARVGDAIRGERGVETACRAIEERFCSSSTGRSGTVSRD